MKAIEREHNLVVAVSMSSMGTTLFFFFLIWMHHLPEFFNCALGTVFTLVECGDFIFLNPLMGSKVTDSLSVLILSESLKTWSSEDTSTHHVQSLRLCFISIFIALYTYEERGLKALLSSARFAN